MCLLLDAMCSKTKTKSKSSSKKTSKKRDCHECTTRKITREELNQMHTPLMPMPMMNQNQSGHNYGYGYGYGDWTAWEDNYPAMISRGQWRGHTQTAQDAYNSSQGNGKRIDEVKSAITGDIKEACKAIKETHASVNSTDSRVKGTRDAIDLAKASIDSTHAAVKEAHAAIQKTQSAIQDKHAEHMSKQEACAADVARVRQLLEEEAGKREETRRMEEMVRYAQSQGLLQTQAQAQTRDHSGGSSQSSTSTTSSTGRGYEGRARTDEERRAEKQRQRERREVERFEHRIFQTKAVRETAETRLRMLEEQERWSRTEGQLEFLRRRDAYFHQPRPQGAYDDVIEAPPYNAYSYVDYGVGGGGAGHRSAYPPRRMQPRCGDGRPWDHS
ncbi:hypothetical protein E0Z10_g8869 [Xylaria hypoxylon]|uniref:Uncharacterized protein n=1 Tax=Xylaria hypoxylon TaxID=37992 RepID=A0A4Z0YIN6_9PEZI|nr:hypothetical protein E0Z10_g8869 [Xylaria hypoxylon]